MRALRRLTLLGLTGVLAGCTTSQIRSTDAVRLSGRLQGTLPPVVVVERKALSPDELGGRMQRLLSSVSLACVADHPPHACGRSHYRHSVRTALDGTFVFHLNGQDTQSALGLQASRIQVAVAIPAAPGQAGGPASSLSLQVQRTQLDLPPLRLWQSGTTVAPGGGGARIAWSALPAEYGPSPAYRVVFDDGAGGLVWDSGDLTGRTSYDVDAHVLEDTVGAVGVLATAEAAVPGSTVGLAFLGPRQRVKGTAGVPLSRDRPCTLTIAGAVVTLMSSPCGLTDGRFDRPGLVVPSPRCTTVDCRQVSASAAIDLGRTVSPTLIVVRGCPQACVVDTSADDVTWQPAGTTSAPNSIVPALPNRPARYVRVSGAANLIGALTEVSVWPARAQSQSTGPSVAPSVALAPAQAHPPGKSNGLVTALATALAVLVVSILVATLRRSRRQSVSGPLP